MQSGHTYFECYYCAACWDARLSNCPSCHSDKIIEVQIWSDCAMSITGPAKSNEPPPDAL